MTDDFEIVLCCLVVVCFAVMFYLAGKADFLTLVPKIFLDKLEKLNRKHGEWVEIDNVVIEHGSLTTKGTTWSCSVCGEARKTHTSPDMNFCPHCGAEMDQKEGAEE